MPVHAPASTEGSRLGSLLFGKLPDQIFRTVVLWLLVAIGLGIMLF